MLLMVLLSLTVLMVLTVLAVLVIIQLSLDYRTLLCNACTTRKTYSFTQKMVAIEY